ncbi:YajQ family cyclic di-GMP-binding protein [Euzebya tangerina]|uniref:YajQ family cyclic di-GMP-binding protein n=1 Tax=Euzebya tangerina TaxID=591198 RepID=UPI000E30E5A3|nr:YajQ family cyclic di-GMP-binding protein [Euzebya tangerina]
MADSSFDVVAEVDRQEVDNALNQAGKELAQRYDFKGTNASIRWSGDEIVIEANSEERVAAALDVFKTRMIKRKLSQKALDVRDVKPAAGSMYRQEVALVSGIPKDKAKAMVKVIKQSKLKVTPAMQDDKIRVSSKSRDALQEVQALLRANDQDLPLRFTNYK